MKSRKRRAIPLIIIFLLFIYIIWNDTDLISHNNITNVISKEVTTVPNDDTSSTQDTVEDSFATTNNSSSATLNHSSVEKNSDILKNEALSSKDLSMLPATSILNLTNFGGDFMDTCFYYEPISNSIRSRIKGYSYNEGGSISLDDLCYVRVLYYGFDFETHIGELIVNKKIADDIIDIFKELYEAKYPIEQMVLVDNYNADDNLSMAANNTSAFNYRVIDGTTRLSNHSTGLAIDINPLYNPYVRTKDGKQNVLPKEGLRYANRLDDFAYKIDENDLCYKAFKKRGFTWGGDWNSSKDYQHFEKIID